MPLRIIFSLFEIWVKMKMIVEKKLEIQGSTQKSLEIKIQGPKFGNPIALYTPMKADVDCTCGGLSFLYKFGILSKFWKKKIK